MAVSEIKEELSLLGDKEKATILKRFFKTGKDQYGEGDKFRGIKVPEIRKLSKKYKDISLSDTKNLLNSKFHEDRLLALFILVLKYQKGDEALKEKIYKLYLANLKYVNNWDLVDLSAEHIIGATLANKDRKLLIKMAKSKVLWERRVAVLSTFNFVKKGEYDQTLQIAEILLRDDEDLIHKAVGWMLREIGKRNIKAEEKFLKKYYKIMPRTMLRYAIEKFPESRRQAYLLGKVS